jgi:fidgetin-like protein 1
MQCKERVDLLEALKASRKEKASGETSGEEKDGKIHKASSRQTPRHSSEEQPRNNGPGYIGNGTIPAVSYEGISKPPALPQRPSLTPKNSSERAVVGRKSDVGWGYRPSGSKFAGEPSTSAGMLVPPMKKTMSRSPSPDKGRTMLHTLRSSDKTGGKPSPRGPRVSAPRRENPVTNKAATLAWQSIGRGGRDRLGRGLDAEVDNSSTALPETGRKDSSSDPTGGRPGSSENVRYDHKIRTLVPDNSHSHPQSSTSPVDLLTGKDDLYGATGRSNAYPGQPGAVSGSMLTASALQDLIDLNPPMSPFGTGPGVPQQKKIPPPPPPHSKNLTKFEPLSYPTYLKEYPETSARKTRAGNDLPLRRKPAAKESAEAESSSRPWRKPVPANTSSPRNRDRHQERDEARKAQGRESKKPKDEDTSSQSIDDDTNSSGNQASKPKRKTKLKQKEKEILADPTTPKSDDSEVEDKDPVKTAWEEKVADLMKNLPRGVDEGAAKQIFNEIVVQGDEVHWDDVAGLDIAKNALKEAVVYPFLRPDLFMGLREPARGMLLFGPPGTGKTMLARAVATESRSTFFSISASSLTSKYLGESEKLVRALFSLAQALAPSIIFVDEIDSLLSSRSGSSEHEATRRIKTEFFIQWSDLQRAAAGREQTDKEKKEGDASRVLVLAATNLPWAIDEAARRRFVRRQYIPLPEDETRAVQLRTLLGHQKHSLNEEDIQRLVELTDGNHSRLPLFPIQANTQTRFLRLRHNGPSQRRSDGPTPLTRRSTAAYVYGPNSADSVCGFRGQFGKY